MDYIQVAVQKIHSTTGAPSDPSTSEPPKYQYQRALSLSKDLGDQVYTYSAEQINQLKAQNALVQRAADAAQKVTAVASSSYGAAQEKVHALSDVMLQELHRVQVCISLTLIFLIPIYIDTEFHCRLPRPPSRPPFNPLSTTSPPKSPAPSRNCLTSSPHRTLCPTVCRRCALRFRSAFSHCSRPRPHAYRITWIR